MPLEQAETVCFDTMMLIWGIKRQAKDGDKHLILKADLLIDRLGGMGSRIMVPTVALSECLVLGEASQRARWYDAISERFQVTPYDAAAAVCGAAIMKAAMEMSHSVAKAEEFGGAHYIKADCMILATAVTRSVRTVYSGDGQMVEIADHYAKSANVKLCVIDFRSITEERQATLGGMDQAAPTGVILPPTE